MKADSRESEAALILCTADPESGGEQIAALVSIAPPPPLPQQTRTIHDVYYDTPDSQLDSRRLALRIRKQNGKSLIALKGPSERALASSLERLEIEADWSWNSVQRILRHLAKRGVMLTNFNERIENANMFIKVLGLDICQTRVTTRTIRKVVQGGVERNAVAELAVDNVEYIFGPGRRVRLHEIEIEAIGSGEMAIQVVSAYLLDRFGNALREWPNSKIKTGKTIEAILKDAVPEGFLDSRNNLTPFAIREIEDRLRNE